MASRAGCPGRGRTIAGDFACNERFELVHRFATGDLEPLALGVRDSHPRELADGRPVERARFERRSDGWQLFERLGDAQLLLRRARLEPEPALDVLAKTAKAQVHVGCCPQRSEQAAAFFGVEPSAFSR